MTQFALFALFAKEGKTREAVVMTSGAFGEKLNFPIANLRWHCLVFALSRVFGKF